MTKLLSFNEDGYQFAWDSTSLSNYVTCPRKYLYSNLQGWQSAAKSVHLIFGGHYASALETYHKLRANGVSWEDAVRQIVRTLMTATWDPDRQCGQDWMHASKTRETLVRSVVWYLDHFAEDTMSTVILQDGRAAVEYSFSLELSDDILYCGHIDRLVEYGGDIYVQDQKTTGGAIGAHFFKGFSPDYQMTGYTFAGSIIFNLPVKGVVIDAARIAVGFTEFGRGFVPRPAPVLEEFREEVLYYTTQARRAHEENFYPMNRKSCGNYGGCEFASICSAIPAHRQALLQASFVKRDRWDPLKKR